MSCRFRTHTTGAATCNRRPRVIYIRHFVHGFTIIELVLVIVIVAILGAIAGPRFFDNASFNERAFHDELVAAIRYGQKIAVASGCSVQVDISTTTWTLTQQSQLSGHCDPADSSFPVPVLLPSGDAMNGAAPGAVTVAPAVTFIYGPLGRTNLGANQVLNIGSRVLSIQAESGTVITQ
ncbi:MAG: GspH/FimT family pseudopilin [Woeseiaceae bacterium]